MDLAILCGTIHCSTSTNSSIPLCCKLFVEHNTPAWLTRSRRWFMAHFEDPRAPGSYVMKKIETLRLRRATRSCKNLNKLQRAKSVILHPCLDNHFPLQLHSKLHLHSTLLLHTQLIMTSCRTPFRARLLPIRPVHQVCLVRPKVSCIFWQPSMPSFGSLRFTILIVSP